jgi:ATP-dependent protease ClpP protease subunit
LHGVATQFPQGARLEEPQLEERLKAMRIDIENIAGIIASTTEKTEEEVTRKMLERTTLSPEEAMDWGLVTDIREQLLPENARLVAIEDPSPHAAPPPQAGVVIGPPNRAELN